MVREMNRLIVVFVIILMTLVTLVPAGCQLSAPDIIEVIAIFPAESGSPPPTGAWGSPGVSANPHPERVQRVFSPGDRMYLGLRVNNEIETSVTFSRFIKVTAEYPSACWGDESGPARNPEWGGSLSRNAPQLAVG